MGQDLGVGGGGCGRVRRVNVESRFWEWAEGGWVGRVGADLRSRSLGGGGDVRRASSGLRFLEWADGNRVGPVGAYLRFGEEARRGGGGGWVGRVNA